MGSIPNTDWDFTLWRANKTHFFLNISTHFYSFFKQNIRWSNFPHAHRMKSIKVRESRLNFALCEEQNNLVIWHTIFQWIFTLKFRNTSALITNLQEDNQWMYNIHICDYCLKSYLYLYFECKIIQKIISKQTNISNFIVIN